MWAHAQRVMHVKKTEKEELQRKKSDEKKRGICLKMVMLTKNELNKPLRRAYVCV